MKTIFLELCSYHAHYLRGNVVLFIFLSNKLRHRAVVNTWQRHLFCLWAGRASSKTDQGRVPSQEHAPFLWHWVMVILLRNGIFICSGTSKPSLVLKSFLLYLWIILQVLYEQSRRHRFRLCSFFLFYVNNPAGEGETSYISMPSLPHTVINKGIYASQEKQEQWDLLTSELSRPWSESTLLEVLM